MYDVHKKLYAKRKYTVIPTEHYRYKVFTESRTWHDARTVCKLLRGDLASVLSKEEEITIAGLIPSSKKRSWFWFGLNDIETERVFVWSDGSESSYQNWVGIEPNNGVPGGEDCMMATGSMEWYDAECQRKEYFVCKFL